MSRLNEIRNNLLREAFNSSLNDRYIAHHIEEAALRQHGSFTISIMRQDTRAEFRADDEAFLKARTELLTKYPDLIKDVTPLRGDAPLYRRKSNVDSSTFVPVYDEVKITLNCD